MKRSNKSKTSMELALLSVIIAGVMSCTAEGNWDCVEVPGYCRQSQICDSITRRCERKCTEHPPRFCPEGTACDYASGACRVWCKSDGRTTEGSCRDGVDDDCDGLSDCADSDCDGKDCGNGCFCGGGMRRETICNDGFDNNSDGLIDCADPNCAGLACRTKDGPCDLEELCVSGNGTCPSNAFLPAGTACVTPSQTPGTCKGDSTCE